MRVTAGAPDARVQPPAESPLLDGQGALVVTGRRYIDGNVRTFVLLRDGGCVARFVNSTFEASRWPMLQGLPDPGQCSNVFGAYDNPNSLLNKELDHVEKADELSFATKPPDDPEHLWTLCNGHHQGRKRGRVWATHEKVREAARSYIVEANVVARKRGWPPYPE